MLTVPRLVARKGMDCTTAKDTVNWTKHYMHKRMRYNDLDKNDLARICTHPLLTREEELILANKIADGCEESFQKLVESNLRLVAHIAKRFVTNRMTLGDAIGHGVIGLQKAARKYDPSRGTKFSTYASWWIHETIRKAFWFQKSSLVKVPIYLQMVEKKVREGDPITERQKLLLQQGKAAQVGNADVHNLPPGNEPYVESDTLEERPFSTELVEALQQCFEKLLPKDQYILGARFGMGKFKEPVSLGELSIIEGVTKSAIQQREARALQRLRAILSEMNPPSN